MKECLLPSPCKNTTLREVNEVVYGISLREWKMLHGIGVWREFCGRVACKRQRIDDSIFDLLNSSETHGHIALGGTLTSID